jgi:protoheme ferro-lyase
MKYWFPSLETVIREMGALSVERAVAVMSKVLTGSSMRMNWASSIAT